MLWSAELSQLFTVTVNTCNIKFNWSFLVRQAWGPRKAMATTRDPPTELPNMQTGVPKMRCLAASLRMAALGMGSMEEALPLQISKQQMKNVDRNVEGRVWEQLEEPKDQAVYLTEACL